MSLQEVVLFSTALLAIVNPLGSAVLFAAVAGKFAPGIQRRMANQSALAILIILLNYGLRMVTVEDTKLTQSEQVSASEVTEEHWKALAVVPLAIPGTVVIQATRVMGILVTATAFGLLGRGIGGLLPGLAK